MSLSKLIMLCLIGFTACSLNLRHDPPIDEDEDENPLPPTGGEPPVPDNPAEPATSPLSLPVPSPYGNPSPPQGKKWVYVWGDEFDGTTLDRTKWKFPPTHWVRGTLTHGGYKINSRWSKENVSVEDGNLVLINTKEIPSPLGGDAMVYAASVYSRGLFEQAYGYFEARVRIPSIVDGMQAAFWLQQYGIPGSVEIDIMESSPGTGIYNIALHWKEPGDTKRRTVGSRPSMPYMHDGDFHVFAVHWHENGYRFYADGELKWTYSGTDGGISHNPQFIYLTTELSWKDGNAYTGTFPNEALVDYVRVWAVVDDR